MTLTAPALVTGSELVTVDTDQAGDLQGALATVSGRLPIGWDGAGERSGGVAGYDLVLAAPRTLSALAWFLLGAGQEELAEPIHQAHEEAVLGVSVEFTCAVGAESPTVVGHGYDSAGQPWSHAHLVYGALAATNHGYQLLVRRSVTELVGAELGLRWAAPATDGSCEVTGLPARALDEIRQPCRPLGEIAACWDSRERR
jgi:hypothetical protein